MKYQKTSLKTIITKFKMRKRKRKMLESRTRKDRGKRLKRMLLPKLFLTAMILKGKV